MRDLTPEEKELIVNTPITMKVVDWCNSDDDDDGLYIEGYCETLERLCGDCEFIRKEYLRTKDERYFDRLVRLLPNSYKVVNLCAERKDICKAKHMVPETPHYGKESKAVPCYTMGSCNDCGLFAEYKRGGRK